MTDRDYDIMCVLDDDDKYIIGALETEVFRRSYVFQESEEEGGEEERGYLDAVDLWAAVNGVA
jgi:hypothetical protein